MGKQGQGTPLSPSLVPSSWPQKRRLLRWVKIVLGVGMMGGLGAQPGLALSTSVGSEGIDARRLHGEPYGLTGGKIAIGQVEIGRPGRFGLDKGTPSPVAVWRVLQLDRWATANDFVDGHAANVASVMISQDKTLTGVAPEALLYAGAVGELDGSRSAQPEECLTTQAVATQNSGDVRALNFSFGEPLRRDPRPNPVLDGNALLTQCIDWLSRHHGALYVIAGNQGRGGIPIPTDNFNGLNIAYSRRDADGRFTRLDQANLGSEPTVRSPRSPNPETNVGARRSITLVAPGHEIEMFDPDGRRRISSGTSFAAPHVVGTLALMQQLVDRQIRAGLSNWSVNGRHPMVMKAALMNAADKLEDNGDGLRLGMARTLVDSSNRPWTDADAYRDRKIPLHSDLGTGHLNAYRAYQQLLPGAFGPEGTIPVVGWNLAEVDRAGTSVHDYVFAEPLRGGGYLSATLAWERVVNLVDDNGNGLYDIGESFQDQGLNDLNLYLMPADSDDLSQSLWSSVSEVDSVEHIFYQIPETGRYKLRVIYQRQVHNQPTQPYGLAWWAVSAP
ncbi:S8 family serine peptidase [Phormidium sp. FACHB-1136]|uniref:S8 family serine peptidase n=1 Tax=Phormidium sp. FACHB-1136 TaxID=2692848 RepID=UPI0018EFA220|nr:S8 family serine peptidase [Phormidium sp. FACHB-1136]